MKCKLCRNREASETLGRIEACYWCACPVRAYFAILKSEVREANTHIQWIDNLKKAMIEGKADA